MKPIVRDWEEVVEEGKARIIIPKRSLYVREDLVYEPAWSPVFYNPVMRVSRDLTVLVARSVYGSSSYFFIDALGGTGVRGIRLALETQGYGIVNDVDPIAYYYISRNIEYNRVENRVKPLMCEANVLLNNYTFSGIPVDYIDIDPYGSPIPFIDSAVKPLAKQALLGVTATDTAPLVCSHARKTLRRYNVNCAKVDFEKELGIRNLIFNLVFRGAAQDRALKPILSYSHRHYFRVFFRTERSGSKSYELMERCRGYIWFCPSTLERGYLKNPADRVECSKPEEPLILGPTWICRLGDPEFAKQVLALAKKEADTLVSRETVKILEILVDEYRIVSPYVRYDKLFGVLKKNMPPIREFIKYLREHGFEAYRTHFDQRGIKTSASLAELYEILGRDEYD